MGAPWERAAKCWDRSTTSMIPYTNEPILKRVHLSQCLVLCHVPPNNVASRPSSPVIGMPFFLFVSRRMRSVRAKVLCFMSGRTVIVAYDELAIIQLVCEASVAGGVICLDIRSQNPSSSSSSRTAIGYLVLVSCSIGRLLSSWFAARYSLLLSL